MAATLIVYVRNDVTLEKWMNVEPERIAQDALVTVQEELEYVKDKASNMS
jgi:hypothetical protein